MEADWGRREKHFFPWDGHMVGVNPAECFGGTC